MIAQATAHLSRDGHYNLTRMTSSTLFWSVGFGFFFGFAFGVGCALAVMYSIYMGGYRAAIRESQLDEPPKRYRDALQKLTSKPPLA
jgi:hypothetical protein